MSDLAAICRRLALVCALALALLTGGTPAFAQIETVDPNAAIDGDLSGAEPTAPQPPVGPPEPTTTYPDRVLDLPPEMVPADPAMDPAVDPATAPVDPTANEASAAVESSDTYKEDDLIGAAEGVFGKGAEGLASLLESILRDQGEPVAYIAGQEAGGAFVVGVRYGSGTMRHQIEGDRPVYWTGPSLGFDAGADANKVFVLVYNLHDSQDLFRRYPAAEGHAYVVGGFTASYLRRGDVVLIPVRLGVGLRLGVNAGYMSFSEKNRWFPF